MIVWVVVGPGGLHVARSSPDAADAWLTAHIAATDCRTDHDVLEVTVDAVPPWWPFESEEAAAAARLEADARAAEQQLVRQRRAWEDACRRLGPEWAEQVRAEMLAVAVSDAVLDQFGDWPLQDP